jgi:murein DD-endopeptidase MepM/ murein hydrolase activator NlpD
MNVIIYSRRGGGARQVDLLRPVPLLVGAAVVATIFLVGYLTSAGQSDELPAEFGQIAAELEEQRVQLADVEKAAGENIDALAVRLGRLNAHIIRLDALGRRLVTMADLDDGEFDFNDAPARGGPDSDDPGPSVESLELNRMLDDLAMQIDDRSSQLAVLEDLMTSRRLSNEQNPEGRPIVSGWISSYFGQRTDPFTGKQKLHRGVDFAGDVGSDVLVVASGVVTWSGHRSGYGTMIEVNHGNGLVTRYAHNQENLVEVGETVKKGQVIALMGSTGRSTGPHVHFEVLRDGRKVNPLRYVKN